MVAHAYLDSVELGVPGTQIGVGDVRPSAGDVDKLAALGKDLNAAATACGEVKIRSVSGGEVGVGAHGAPGQFDVGREMAGMEARVPAQNDRLKASTVD